VGQPQRHTEKWFNELADIAKSSKALQCSWKAQQHPAGLLGRNPKELCQVTPKNIAIATFRIQELEN
jgi:hypothetical protein